MGGKCRKSTWGVDRVFDMFRHVGSCSTRQGGMLHEADDRGGVERVEIWPIGPSVV